jgi:hypothetical protein
MTLSHCWGDSNDGTVLTVDMVESWKIEIPALTKMRMFRDAIAIARRLEIQYIWIDSLCII